MAEEDARVFTERGRKSLEQAARAGNRNALTGQRYYKKR